MKVTISEYRAAVVDVNGNVLMMSGAPVASQKLTANGTTSAFSDETRFIRVATDTAIHLAWDGGAADTDPMMPANSVEYFGGYEAATLTILTA